jgi:hypothetical protein
MKDCRRPPVTRLARRGLRAAAPTKAGERGAALVIAILVLAILTVIGIALMLVTSTESRIAANEWSINRAFYASDSGIRWASVEMHNLEFLFRPEFGGAPPSPRLPFGTVFFQLPSHRSSIGSLFLADLPGGDIAVRLQMPSLMGRRPAKGERVNAGTTTARYIYSYEVRSASSDQAFAQYAKALVAQVDRGPLP